jgi:hypothetical protein
MPRWQPTWVASLSRSAVASRPTAAHRRRARAPVGCGSPRRANGRLICPRLPDALMRPTCQPHRGPHEPSAHGASSHRPSSSYSVHVCSRSVGSAVPRSDMWRGGCCSEQCLEPQRRIARSVLRQDLRGRCARRGVARECRICGSRRAQAGRTLLQVSASARRPDARPSTRSCASHSCPSPSRRSPPGASSHRSSAPAGGSPATHPPGIEPSTAGGSSPLPSAPGGDASSRSSTRCRGAGLAPPVMAASSSMSRLQALHAASRQARASGLRPGA